MTRPDDDRATLSNDEDGRVRIELRRTLPIGPVDAWTWLTDADRLAEWLPDCRLDPRVGGSIRFDFGEDLVATGTVLVAEPATDDAPDGRYAHTWQWEGIDDSVVTWSVSPDGTGATALGLVHDGADADAATEFAIGWHVMLDALALAVDGEDDAVERAWDRLDEISDAYGS
ncbi:uncharacterized protein YndB with AHSA1/START domain [Pseudoclavibacter chungangensis]|uniref:SRPBCC domain-containing protein n=1 Tax=Pseudoclavibacter chungangensis TaxID=587635 RepID=UPI0015CA6E22|nr:SRPBCC domain-containing protein [Pseudoclavibacter chungangensis]NYJ65809.1 uncharacterized protein YndB with AHSA1/START domain [Pseudoclavibacter chungangensis]